MLSLDLLCIGSKRGRSWDSSWVREESLYGTARTREAALGQEEQKGLSRWLESDDQMTRTERSIPLPSSMTSALSDGRIHNKLRVSDPGSNVLRRDRASRVRSYLVASSKPRYERIG